MKTFSNMCTPDLAITRFAYELLLHDLMEGLVSVKPQSPPGFPEMSESDKMLALKESSSFPARLDELINVIDQELQERKVRFLHAVIE